MSTCGLLITIAQDSGLQYSNIHVSGHSYREPDPVSNPRKGITKRKENMI